MTRERPSTSGDDRIRHIDVFLGAAPLLEVRLVEGLLEFGRSHPTWRFSLRSAEFRYTPNWFRRHPLDGVLILIDGTHVARALKAAGRPFVKLVPATLEAAGCVGVDDLAIGRLGAEHLLGKGFLKCAFCGVGTSWSVTRQAGFMGRMAEAGLAARFIDIPFDPGHSWSLGPAAVRRLTRWLEACEPGTAVMAAHDALANRLVDICRQKRIRVPQDLAVLGVGDHALLCELSPVPISSIDAAVPQVARRGAEMLEGMLERAGEATSCLVAPAGVVERRSTAITVYGDNIVARVVDYIRREIRTLDGIDDVLRAFPISRRTLDRRFVKFVGRTVAEDIRLARLGLARERVETTSQPLSEIAHACGYADLSHMDGAFKKAFGRTPGALRRR
jgi:LacI family transcriptional regulator